MTNSGIPTATVRDSRYHRRLFLAIVGAVAIGAALWLVGPIIGSLIGGLVILTLGAGWGLRRWIAESESPTPRPPEGELIYALRPRAWMVLLALGAGPTSVIGFASRTADGALIGSIATLVTVILAVACIRALVLRQRVRLTETDLELPRSPWSHEIETVELERLTASLSKNGTLLWLTIRGEQRAISSHMLGDRAIRELAAALVHRIAIAAQRKREQPERRR